MKEKKGMKGLFDKFPCFGSSGAQTARRKRIRINIRMAPGNGQVSGKVAVEEKHSVHKTVMPALS